MARETRADAPQSYAMFVDESVRGQLIVVAGYIVALHDVPRIVDMWRKLKTTLGVRPETELKWTLGQSDPVRAKLEANGWTHARMCPAVLRTIAPMPITVVADVLLVSEHFQPERYYDDAFQWLLLGFRNFLVRDRPRTERPVGPHMVLVDRPPRADRRAAAEDAYRDMYWNGMSFAMPYGIQAIDNLKSLGFMPSVLQGHARNDDTLQIADALAGCVRDFITYNVFAEGRNLDLPEERFQDQNFRIIAPRFRGYDVRKLWSYGLQVFPRRHPRLLALERLFTRDWIYEAEVAQQVG
jgi:hypothetical protein